MNSTASPWTPDTQVEARYATTGFECEVRACEWQRPTVSQYHLETHVLWMSLSPQPKTELQLDDADTAPRSTGLANLLPAAVSMRSRSSGGMQRLLVCRIAPERVEQLVDHRARALRKGWHAGLNLRHESMLSSLRRVSTELETPGFASAQMLEALAQTLTIDTARFLYDSPSPQHRGGLAPWQLRRIEHRLEMDLPPRLEELATLCGISVRHLMRAYKQSTGSTMHQRVAELQIERAKRLLAHSELPISSIALQIGFAHVSGFSIAFRRATRETPKEYRQRQRSIRVALQ